MLLFFSFWQESKGDESKHSKASQIDFTWTEIAKVSVKLAQGRLVEMPKGSKDTVQLLQRDICDKLGAITKFCVALGKGLKNN